MTHIESVIDPYRVADDFRRESVSLVSIHRIILAIPSSLFVSTHELARNTRLIQVQMRAFL